MSGHIVNKRNTDIAPGMSVKFLQGSVAIFQFEHKTGVVCDDNKIFTVTKVDGLWCNLFWMDQKSKQVITYQTLLTNMKLVENAPSTDMITETTKKDGGVMKLCKRIKRKVMNTTNNDDAKKDAANIPKSNSSSKLQATLEQKDKSPRNAKPAGTRIVMNCHKPDGIRLVCTRSRIAA